MKQPRIADSSGTCSAYHALGGADGGPWKQVPIMQEHKTLKLFSPSGHNSGIFQI